MILYEKSLCFDSCAGDLIAFTLLTLLVLAGSASVGYIVAVLVRKPHLRFRSATISLVIGIGLIGLFAASLIFPIFDPELTRVAFINGKAGISHCDGVARVDRQYLVSDIDYRYEETVRGSRQIVDRWLVLLARGDSNPVARINLSLPGSNIAVLRQVAPGPMATYDRSPKTR
jgi:hypothetical protein